MGESSLLSFIVLLAIIEIGLIYSLYQVKITMQQLNKNLQAIGLLKQDIHIVKRRLNGFFSEMMKLNGQSLTIKGESKMLGKIDLNVKLKR